MRLVAAAALLAFTTGASQAENCGKSRDYLLGSLSGDMMLPPQAYKDLFNVCIKTAAMANVKDVYILKDGGIAVVPKQDSVAATAGTLSQFCDAYPRATLHFLTAKEILVAKSMSAVVQISSTSSTSCKKIKGIS
jgi:hypothetical protein